MDVIIDNGYNIVDNTDYLLMVPSFYHIHVYITASLWYSRIDSQNLHAMYHTICAPYQYNKSETKQ